MYRHLFVVLIGLNSCLLSTTLHAYVGRSIGAKPITRAQFYPSNKFTDDEGYRFDRVKHFSRHPSGVVLFATTSRLFVYDWQKVEPVSLVSPDGKQVKVGRITALSIDEDGRIWIGSILGLYVIDSNIKYTNPIHQIRGKVNGLNISNKGYVSLAPKTLYTFQLPQKIGKYLPNVRKFELPSATREIKVIDDQNLLLATFIDGLFEANMDSDTTWSFNRVDFDRGRFSKHECVINIRMNPDSTFWVCSEGAGLFHFKKDEFDGYQTQQFTDLSNKKGFIHYPLNVETMEEQLVLTTRTYGLFILDRHENEVSLNTQILPYNDVLSFNVTSNNSMLLGLNTGVLEMRRRQDAIIHHKGFVSSDVLDQNGTANRILRSSGYTFFANPYGLTSIFRHKSNEVYQRHVLQIKDGYRPDVISILNYQNRDLLVGSDRGILQWNPESQKFEPYNKIIQQYKIKYKAVLSMLENEAGDIWVGTFGQGLVQLKKRKGGHFDVIDKIKIYGKKFKGPVKHLIQTSDGLLCGLAGINIFAQKADSMTMHMVCAVPAVPFHLLEYENGKILAPTKKGVFQVDIEKGTYKKLKTNNLFEPIISLAKDKNNNIWFGTKSMIGKCSKMVGDSMKLHLVDQVGDVKLLEGSVDYDAEENMLFFGASEGYLSVDLDKVSIPNVSLEAKVRRVEVKDGVDQDTVIKAVPHLQTGQDFTLYPGENDIRIHFGLKDPFWLNEVRFVYRVNNKEEGYTKVGFNSADINQLPIGVSKLEYYAEDKLGNIGPTYTYTITVVPPFYLSVWAIFTYILLTGLLIYIFINLIRKRRIANRRLKLAELEYAKNEYMQDVRMKFYTGVSHDLKTPLTLIMAPINKLLEKDTSKEDTLAYGNIIKQNADRLLELINQILDLRKIDDQAMVLNLAPASLDRLVMHTLNRFETAFKEKNITLHCQNTSLHQRLVFDYETLQKILSNLLSNALKYTPDHGEVWVKLEVGKLDLSNYEVFLSVSDTGPGIPDKYKKAIFNPYFRNSDTADEAMGVGVGLALVDELVTLHGGHISVADNQPKGSIFTVMLTLSAEEKEVQETFEPVIRNLDDDEDALQLLIIEDEKDVRNFLATELGKDYQVSLASSGEEAIKLIERDLPDIVLSDLMLPDISGLDVCKRLKSSQAAVHVPFVLLTANTAEESRRLAYQAGINAFLPKPFSIELVKSCLKNLLLHRQELQQVVQNKILGLEIEELPRAQGDFIHLVNKIMKEQISDSGFQIDDIAEQMNLSRTVFYKKCKQITGKTPNNLLKGYRLEKSKSLLESGQTVKEVALSCGFQTTSYFSRVFKAEYGQSPSEIAKSMD